MAARLRAISDPGSNRRILDGLGLGLCLLAASAAGCASTDSGASASLRKATPTFMLSDQEKAERNLKDPAALHVAYGHFEEQVGQPDEARKSYERALGENPHSFDAVLGLARLDQLAEKPKEAEAEFQRALKLRPGDPTVLAACGQFYGSQKRWPEALQYLNAAVAAAPSVAMYKHELAKAEIRAGDINTGLAAFTQLVGRDKAHYNVAFLLAQEGKSDAAAQECRAALSVNPQFEPAKTMLNQIQNHQVVGDPRGINRPNPTGQVRATTNAAPVAGFAPGTANNSNRPASSTTQASWQAAAGANGFGTATRADATTDPTLPKAGGSSHTATSADYSSNPWDTTPAPQR
jgi:tetratricopeptide (TPR) repeat protein